MPKRMAASVMCAKPTRRFPPLFLIYPQLQRRHAPSRPAFSTRNPSHIPTNDASRGAVTAPNRLDKMPQLALDPSREELRNRAQRGAAVRERE